MSTGWSPWAAVAREVIKKLEADNPAMAIHFQAEFERGRQEGAVARAAAHQEVQRRIASDPNRAEGLRLLRDILAGIPNPVVKQKDIDPAEAWLDALGWFDLNSESAPKWSKFVALRERRRVLKKSVRRRFKELGIR